MRKLFFALWAMALLVGCSSETTFKPANQLAVLNANIDLVDTTHRYEVHLTYPIIEGDISLPIQQKLNQTLTQEFNKACNQDEFIESHKSLADTLFNHSDWTGHLSNTYQAFQCDTLLTVHFFIHHYYLGAAHGSSTNKTLHFNINNGQLLDFNAFFKSDSNALALLKNQINTTLADSICWGIEGDTGIAKHLSNFIIAPDSVTFKFNDYDLCPYALAITEVKLSTNAIATAFNHVPTFKCNELVAPEITSEIATH